jgi:hypothetical protein
MTTPISPTTNTINSPIINSNTNINPIPMEPMESDEHPHLLADSIYEAICKDTEEKPTAKGKII